LISKEPIGFIDPELVQWQPEADIDGLFSKTLAKCRDTGSYTRLLKFLPGTDTSEAGPQSHDHLEELWIVSGAIHDLTLDQNFVAGMYANRLYEMAHGPWRAPNGAVTFELRDFDPDGQISKEQLEFIDPDLLSWEPAGEGSGVFVKPLTRCQKTGSYGRLVKFQPGAVQTTRSAEGTARSEIWIVGGELESADGQLHPAGSYGNVDIDLLDGGWTSSRGCVVFEVRNLI